MRKRVLFVFPTGWDRRQLEACRHAWAEGFEPLYTEPSADAVLHDFDVLGFIDATAERWRGRIDGVTSSSDYPGATVAAALATELGLPGSRPEAILGAAHKYLSRQNQRTAVPEAVPGFALVDSAVPAAVAAELAYPCFVKPVKGAYSIHSGRVDSAGELVSFLSTEAVRTFAAGHMKVFDALLGRYLPTPVGGRFFLAEELLTGRLATVEGYVSGGEVEVLGVVDSVTDPATGSFVRFDYPSDLPAAVQEEMASISARAIRASGLESTLFNLETIWDPATGRISIVEINPRMCGQFSDLYAKVDGVAGYEAALALAAGERPRLGHRAGPHGAAASVPLRVFDPVRVARAPDLDALAAAGAPPRHPHLDRVCRGGRADRLRLVGGRQELPLRRRQPRCPRPRDAPRAVGGSAGATRLPVRAARAGALSGEQRLERCLDPRPAAAACSQQSFTARASEAG